MNNTQPSFRSYISGKQLPAAHGAPPEFQAITKTRQTTCTPTTASGGRKNTSITFSPHFFYVSPRSFLTMHPWTCSVSAGPGVGRVREDGGRVVPQCPSLKAQPSIPMSGIVFVLFLPAAGPCKRSCKGPSEPQTYCRIWHPRFFTWMS